MDAMFVPDYFDRPPFRIFVRMAAKFTSGSRQLKLAVPEQMLYAAQWNAWVVVVEI